MNKSIQERLKEQTNYSGPFPSKEAIEQYPKIEGKRCWTWNGKVHSKRYVDIYYKGKLWKLHRLTWYLTKGRIPKKLKVCHKCDVMHCRRPSHLFLGTQKENMQDCHRKGRYSVGRSHGAAVAANHPDFRGELNPCSAFSNKRVLKIRKMYSDGGYSYQDIADMYNVSKRTIANIIVRKNYTHI